MRVAGLVQLVLLGLFAAIGLAVTAIVAVDWFQKLDTWSWEEATCTIEQSAAADERQYGEYQLLLSYRYSYRGEQYRAHDYRHGGQGFEQRSDAVVLAARYPVGSEVRCWVDPEEPERAYLRRGNLWHGLWILAPLFFVAVGVGGIWLLRSRRAREEPAASPAAGSGGRSGIFIGGMFFLFGSFFLVGTGMLVPFFIRPALQVLSARSWEPVGCEVLSSRVRVHPGDETDTYSLDVLYRYEFGGREYKSNRYQFLGGATSGYDRRAKVVEALSPGSRATCYVDPTDPHEAVVERGFTADYLFGLMPLIFALIGLGGLVFTVGILRGARKDASRPAWEPLADPSSWSWSGETEADAAAAASGPLVLEPTRGPLGKLGCALLGALFWNGFISLFVWQIVSEWRAGNPQWFAALVVAPFVLIGLALLASIPYSVLALLNPRPRVHLSPGAVAAGETAQLEWAFRGAGSRVRRLRIWLEATEIRSRATDSSVHLETAPLDHPPIEILDRGGELPLEYGAVSFEVPADTPPTTDGDPLVRWKLELRGEIAFWPDVEAEYEVTILPAEAG